MILDGKKEPVAILMRHAECRKNLNNIIGGTSSGQLTEKGLSSLERLFETTPELRSLKSIWFSPSEQCKQTATLLSKKLKLEAHESELLLPLNLGVLAGLTLTQSESKYPEAHLSMDLWRRGELDILDLKVPSLGDPFSFYQQGERFFARLADHPRPALIIGTRSVLIMLKN